MNNMLLIFGIAYGLLVLFSLIGWYLKAKLREGANPSGINNFNARTKAWWWMVSLLAFAFWFGYSGIIILFLFISFQALREFLSLTYTRRGDHRALLWSFFFFLPLQYYLIYIDWYGLFTILIPVYAFLLLPISASLGRDPTDFLQRTSQVQWALMVCVYCLSHLPALMTLDIPDYSHNALLILFLIFTVQASDVSQYVWGKLCGRHKIAPEISPSKTWEGLIGGVLTASLIGASLWWITPFTLWQAALIAFVLNMMGFFGGFVLSAIKRDLGAKDWGRIIEGHGGVLDRVDSICFSAPIFFHILHYWWVP